MSQQEPPLSDQVERFADENDLSNDAYTRIVDAVEVIREHESS